LRRPKLQNNEIVAPEEEVEEEEVVVVCNYFTVKYEPVLGAAIHLS
jgi:hypothetical protein